MEEGKSVGIRSFKFFIYLFIYLFSYLFIMCCGAYVDIRGQREEISALLQACGPWGLNSGP